MTKMRTISEYKDMALESLSDNWGQGALVTFVYLLTYCGIIFTIALLVNIFSTGNNKQKENNDFNF